VVASGFLAWPHALRSIAAATHNARTMIRLFFIVFVTSILPILYTGTAVDNLKNMRLSDKYYIHDYTHLNDIFSIIILLFRTRNLSGQVSSFFLLFSFLKAAAMPIMIHTNASIAISHTEPDGRGPRFLLFRSSSSWSSVLIWSRR